MWKELLQNQFDLVIDCLNTIKIKETSGFGEFLYSIISKDVKCNTNDIDDILYLNNTVGEIKCAVNKQKAGRLLFKRDNYFGFNNASIYITEQKKLLTNFVKLYIDDIILSQTLLDIINNANHFEYSWYGVYKQIYNILIQNELNKLCTFFIKYIFINSVNGWNPIKFINLDLSNEDTFKIFHIVNYCLYYIQVDAASENIDKLIFIANNELLILSKELLLNGTLDELKIILNHWHIAYPTSRFN